MRKYFRSNEGEYYDIESMKWRCTYRGALHFTPEREIRSFKIHPRAAEYCNGASIALSTPFYLHPTLQSLSSDNTSFSQLFRTKLQPYNNSLQMRCVGAQWNSIGTSNYTFNPTITLHGRVYHYREAVLLPWNLPQYFLSVYIHDMDCDKRPNWLCSSEYSSSWHLTTAHCNASWIQSVSAISVEFTELGRTGLVLKKLLNGSSRKQKAFFIKRSSI